jgi:PAS domain S-box-containing protein
MKTRAEKGTMLKVLCLEDSPRDLELMRELLLNAGFDLDMDWTAVESEFVSFLRNGTYDLILSDFKLPGFDAFAALRWSNEICPTVPFICVSGTVGEETAIELLKRGAVDYVLKDRPTKLPSAIERALVEAKEKEARRRAEELVKSQYTLLTALINSPKDLIIFSLDTNYCYTTFNEKHREEMKRVWNTDIRIGMNLLDCMQILELRGLAKQSIDRALQGEAFSEIQHQSDLDIYYEFSWDPIYQNSEVIGVTVFIRDITERKRAEEGLRESEEFTRRIIDSSNDCIKVLDLEGHLLSMSGGGQKLLEIDDIGLYLNKSWVDFWKGKDRDAALEAIAKAMKGDAGTFYGYCETAKGTPKWWEIIVSPIKDVHGSAERLLALSRDITDRKRAEEKIQKLNIELEQRVLERTAQLENANKELEAFSYSVSHDLRAPLRAIDGFSRIVLEEYQNKLDAEGCRLLNVICANTGKMDQLITDLLDLSHVSRNEMKVSRVDMTTLANSIYHEIASPETQKQCLFSVAPLPDVYCDPGLMRQVWRNVISNAVKFTQTKDVREIKIGGGMEKGICTYFIKDSGVGFDPQYTHKLFGVFQRLHNSEDFEGTGVGLAIVQRIIHRHRGRVWAEGILGRGATFYFSIPLKENPHEQ